MNPDPTGSGSGSTPLCIIQSLNINVVVTGRPYGNLHQSSYLPLASKEPNCCIIQSLNIKKNNFQGLKYFFLNNLYINKNRVTRDKVGRSILVFFNSRACGGRQRLVPQQLLSAILIPRNWTHSRENGSFDFFRFF